MPRGVDTGQSVIIKPSGGGNLAMVDVKMKGFEEFRRLLDRLPERLQKGVEKRAMRAAAAVVRKQMRANAPKDTGLLKLSIGTKVKRYRKSKTVVGIIGARTDFESKKASRIQRGLFEGTIKLKKYKPRGFTPKPSEKTRKKRSARREHQARNPAKYLHLVEFGNYGHKGSGFMRKSWQQSRHKAERRLATKTAEILEKMAKKGAR